MSYIDKDGYRRIPAGARGKGKLEHVAIAEATLGKALPLGAIVHHANGERDDNSRGNLVICSSRAYHNMLHARMRAMEVCGNPNWMKCCRCLKYDALENLSLSGSRAYHRECNAAHVKRMREKNVD